jgi:hypothetical protein
MTQMLTIQQVADHFQKSTSTIRRYVRFRQIKFTRITTRLMFSAEEVARIEREGLPSIPLPKKKVTAPAMARKVRAARS